MTLRKIVCRDHGGTFRIPARRGRPPVRCNDENKCTKFEKTDVAEARKRVSAPEKTASQIKNRRSAERGYNPADDQSAMAGADNSPYPTQQAETPQNTSLAPAQVAKELLVGQNWIVSGRAWSESRPPRDGERVQMHYAELTATRGEELITMLWVDGELDAQTYSLWNMEKPSVNGKPNTAALDAELDELTDKELIQRIAGQRVTWWNRLGKNKESAIVSGNKIIQIDHTYNGIGDETPADRVIKFVDYGGGGFRAFRAGAIVKIG
jgi:hypothetical protein